MRSTISLLLTLIFGVGCAADAVAIEPAPADQKLAQDSSIDQILDALDARGKDLHSLSADVTMTETDPDTGDESLRRGKVWLQINADGAARFRAMFNQRQANNHITEDRIEYLLDGPNLIDRTYHTKTQVTRQVLKPGEKINLLKLGEGPFPLPIGQPKEEVHRAFEVSKAKPRQDDPSDTLHITLTPQPDSQFARQFKSIDVWVDATDHMPKRIETLDVNGTTVRTTDLTNVQINPKLTDADFAMPKVDDSWTLLDEAFKK